ncbi:MAG: hypothetical protein ACI841_002689 [Planctomycetota bacterium]|jgi:hypothetical protein
MRPRRLLAARLRKSVASAAKREPPKRAGLPSRKLRVLMGSRARKRSLAKSVLLAPGVERESRVKNVERESRVKNVVRESRVKNVVRESCVKNVVRESRVKNVVRESRVKNVVRESRVKNVVRENRVKNETIVKRASLASNATVRTRRATLVSEPITMTSRVNLAPNADSATRTNAVRSAAKVVKGISRDPKVTRTGKASRVADSSNRKAGSNASKADSNASKADSNASKADSSNRKADSNASKAHSSNRRVEGGNATAVARASSTRIRASVGRTASNRSTRSRMAPRR